MNTQNLDYNEIAKENIIVANALRSRDDEQVEVLAIDEQMAELQAKLDELQESKAKATEKLAAADDKLFALATMAQDCKEQIEAVKAEHEKELKGYFHSRLGAIFSDINTAVKNGEINDDLLSESADKIERLFTSGPTNLEEHKEVQEELELAS